VGRRLWLLNAFAVALLTLLGAAGEALGYDRHVKSNTSKRRTHSLFRQGCMLYEPDTDDAGSKVATAHRIFWRDAGGTAGFRRSLWGDLK
jgi:hypothetical protein